MSASNEQPPLQEVPTALPVSDGARPPAASRRRRLLFAIGAALILLLVCVLCSTARYLQERRPLADLPPVKAIAGPVPPHYVFSFPSANPNGVAVTPDGSRVYVVETLAGESQQVKAFDRDGKYLFSINPPPELVDPVSNPIYVALDKEGRVYVVDRITHKIFIYDADGKFISVFPDPELGDVLPPLGEALAQQPTYLNVNAATGFTTFDRPTRSVQLYTLNGELVENFGAGGDRFWVQQGISFDQDDNLYVTEVTSGHHRVWIFDPQGLVKRRFGSEGQGLDQFEHPNDVAVDSRGHLYVSDTDNGRVKILSRSGRFINALGHADGLSLQQGVAIDRDWLYVVDSVGGVVHIFDVSGNQPKFLFDIGTFGTGTSQFNYPADIALDSTGRLYVTDRANNRVQVWSY